MQISRSQTTPMRLAPPPAYCFIAMLCMVANDKESIGSHSKPEVKGSVTERAFLHTNQPANRCLMEETRSNNLQIASFQIANFQIKPLAGRKHSEHRFILQANYLQINTLAKTRTHYFIQNTTTNPHFIPLLKSNI